MATRMQVTIDCADPAKLAAFWVAALGYEVEQPPDGSASWQEYWVKRGFPAEEFDEGYDSIVDPAGVGPRIWFQPVPEPKTVKNRLHLDLSVSGGRAVPIDTRRERVDAEAERLLGLGAVRLRVSFEEGLDHYGVVMQDPEGNEFCLH